MRGHVDVNVDVDMDRVTRLTSRAARRTAARNSASTSNMSPSLPPHSGNMSSNARYSTCSGMGGSPARRDASGTGYIIGGWSKKAAELLVVSGADGGAISAAGAGASANVSFLRLSRRAGAVTADARRRRSGRVAAGANEVVLVIAQSPTMTVSKSKRASGRLHISFCFRFRTRPLPACTRNQCSVTAVTSVESETGEEGQRGHVRKHARPRARTFTKNHAEASTWAAQRLHTPPPSRRSREGTSLARRHAFQVPCFEEVVGALWSIRPVFVPGRSWG